MLIYIRGFLFILATILSLVWILPISILRPKNAKNNASFFRIFTPLACFILGVKVKVINSDILDKNHPSVVISNHQHNYDLFVLGQVFKGQTIVLGKKQLSYLPLFGQVFTLAGNIYVDRSNRKKSIQSMKDLEVKVKKDKLSIFIFPEGTRNKNKELLPFKKGAFYTAIKCQIPIVPISVTQYANTFDFNRWNAGEIILTVHSPISTEGLIHKDTKQLMDKAYKVIQEPFY